MNKIKNFEEFEKRLRNEPIAMQPMQKQKLIQRLATYSQPKTKRLSFVLIISMFLLFSVAAAGAGGFSGLTFFKNDGSTIIEMDTMSEEEMRPHLVSNKIIKKNLNLMDELRKTVPEGKFLYFLDVNVYEQTGEINIFHLYNHQSIKNVDEIPRSFAKNINLQNSILNDYEIKNGTIIYNTPHSTIDDLENLAKKLQQQAKESNKYYGILEGDLTQDIGSVSLWYETNDFPFFKSFEITIQSINRNVKTSEDLSSFTKINSELGDNVYYSEDERKLLVVTKDDHKNYLISVRNPVISEGNIELQRFIDVAKHLVHGKE
ncbi:hypothetical protein MKZ17_12735 [Solibacillus sp. FSL R7-0682]|uniref:hypothetical protein n=1 Tax=Solibacillus sp. FSL R7-0682 TaxID=2921690 RepID=UPI0030F62623